MPSQFHTHTPLYDVVESSIEHGAGLRGHPFLPATCPVLCRGRSEEEERK